PFTPTLFHFTLLTPSASHPLSLHDALPIYSSSKSTPWSVVQSQALFSRATCAPVQGFLVRSCVGILRFTHKIVLENLELARKLQDRKSTRLNSSHVSISYAVFCLKKKKYTI